MLRKAFLAMAIGMLCSSPAVAQVLLTDADPIGLGPAGSKAGTYVDQGVLGGGDTRRDLVIGAPGTGSVKGAVYLMFGGPVPSGEFALTTVDVIITSANTGDNFGRATAVGNISLTSGSADLVVGAPGALTGRGAVYLFRGTNSDGSFQSGVDLTSANALLTVRGNTGDALGTSLATADLTGDGYREIIIGAPGNNRVYVIKGGPLTSCPCTLDLSSQSARITMTANGIGDVVAAGDVTGDGLSDIFIGAPGVLGGKVYFLAGRAGDPFGSNLNLATDADAVFNGNDTSDQAGKSIVLPDINSDGVRDLVISAPGGDGAGELRLNSGEVYVIFGNAPLCTGGGVCARNLATADAIVYGSSTNHLLGSPMAQGDINRDGADDLVMSASGASATGDLFVYYGRSRNSMGTLVGSQRIIDLATASNVNRRVAGDASHGPIAGLAVFEVTGEGSRDIMAGVPTSGSNAGRVFFSISPRLRLSTNSMTVYVNQGTSQLNSITVNNPSSIPVTWTAASNRSYMSVGPTSGSTSSASPTRLDFAIDAGALAPGVYPGGRVRVTSTSFDVEMQVDLNLTIVVTSMQINFYSPAAGATVAQPFNIVGWAADFAATSGTGVDGVRVYADPNPGSGAPRLLLGDATYGTFRPDVAAAYGARYGNSGFTYNVSGLAPGVYRFLVFARPTGSGVFNAYKELTVTITAPPIVPNDFDGDGRFDLVWQHHTQGYISLWKMNGHTLIDAVNFNPGRVMDTNWKIVGTGDFNADNKPDLLWQHRTQGLLSVWLMNGVNLIDAFLLNPSTVSDPNWYVVAVADFNRDGKPDLLWQHQTNGTLSVWYMNGTTLIDAVLLNPGQVGDANWKIVGTGDFNRDGRVDIVFRHITAGWVSVWYMNGVTLTEAVYVNPANVPAVWNIRAVGDADNDGHPDLVWQHNDGYLSIWYMENVSLRQAVQVNPYQVSDTNWKIAGPR